MTVKDLLDILTYFPSDMEVIVDGYEEGYEPLQSKNVVEVHMIRNHHGFKDGIYGRHGHPYSWPDIREPHEDANLHAVLIGRHRSFWRDT